MILHSQSGWSLDITDKTRLVGNRVLVRVSRDPKELNMKRASGLWLPGALAGLDDKGDKDAFNANWFLVTTGEIVAHCETLNDAEFDVEVDVTVGDKVHFDYTVTQTALQRGSVFACIEDNSHYIFMDYARLYCRTREGVTVGLNGTYLYDPIENPAYETSHLKVKLATVEDLVAIEQERAGGQDVREAKQKEWKPNEGVVWAAPASPIKSYRDSNWNADTGQVTVGSRILIEHMIPLENSLARELDGKPKFLTQEKNIIGWWWPYAVATTNGVVPILSQQKETFMLGQHHLMVRLVPEKRMTESGIVFPKSKQQTYLGEVIQVSMWEEEVTVGDMVAFKASPSGRFEYFGEDVVLLPKRLALVRIRDNKMQAI